MKPYEILSATFLVIHIEWKINNAAIEISYRKTEICDTLVEDNRLTVGPYGKVCDIRKIE